MNQLIVSRPTFAEIVSSATKNGCTEALCEDGVMRFPALAIASAGDTDTAPGRAARAAVEIEQSASPAGTSAMVYEHDGIRISARCRPDGVHVIRANTLNATAATVIIPFDAVTATVGALLDCAAARKH